MLRTIVGVSAAALVAAVAAPSFAQPVAQPAYSKADVSAFHGGPGALIRVIHDIENATGGEVVDVRFSDRNGRPGYYAAVVKGGQVQFVRFSEGGGLVALTDTSEPVWLLDWRQRRDVHLAMRAPVPLTRAVRVAEASANGAPAVAAGIARSASNPTSDVHAYNILVLRDGQTRRIAVDSQTGEVIADPQALAGWP